MQIDIISQSEPGAQVSPDIHVPKNLIRIAVTSEELNEPKDFILQAIKTIKTAKAIGQKPEKTALKCIGLMLAAATLARSKGRGSDDPNYDPLPDLVDLDAIAKSKLGPAKCLDPASPVAMFRDATSGTIISLREPCP